jgi:hypothetical protein
VPWGASASRSEGPAIIPLYLPDAPLRGRNSYCVGNPAAPKLFLGKGLVNLSPELENVRLSHSWFGNVAMNRDMLPRILEKNGVVYAIGFCGSGVVGAPWIGTHAAHTVLGHSEQARTAFDFRPPTLIHSIVAIRGSYRPSFKVIGYRTASPCGAPAADRRITRLVRQESSHRSCYQRLEFGERYRPQRRRRCKRL